jgi:hypothetical protein
MRASVSVICLAVFLASPAAAVDGDATLCSGKANIVLNARMPAVDLFDAPSGGKVVATITNDKFPPCLPILEQSPAFTLKVQINGGQYWIQPSTVRFRTKPASCAPSLVQNSDTKLGATRGLGEGC